MSGWERKVVWACIALRTPVLRRSQLPAPRGCARGQDWGPGAPSPQHLQSRLEILEDTPLEKGMQGVTKEGAFSAPPPPILLQRQLVGPEFFAITPKVHVRVFVRKEAVLSKVTETKGKTNPPSAFLQH